MKSYNVQNRQTENRGELVSLYAINVYSEDNKNKEYRGYSLYFLSLSRKSRFTLRRSKQTTPRCR